MPGSNQTAGRWPVVVKRGDTLEAVPFALTRNASTWTPTGATAMARRGPSRQTGKLADLTATLSTGTLSLFGDVVDLEPGRYWWDVQVTDTAISATYRRTLLAGEFVVEDDVTT